MEGKIQREPVGLLAMEIHNRFPAWFDLFVWLTETPLDLNRSSPCHGSINRLTDGSISILRPLSPSPPASHLGGLGVCFVSGKSHSLSRQEESFIVELRPRVRVKVARRLGNELLVYLSTGR